jgi:WD40 repeat protein
MEFVCGTYEGSLLGLELSPSGGESKQEIKTSFLINPHLGSVKCVGYSAPWIVSGSADQSVRLFDWAKKKEYGALFRHKGAVHCVEFHSDEYLFSAGENQTVYIWNTKKWECLARLKNTAVQTTKPVVSMAFHASGRVLLCLTQDGVVSMWNVLNCRLAHSRRVAGLHPLHEECVSVLWVSENEYIVVTTKKIMLFSSSDVEEAEWQLDAPTALYSAAIVPPADGAQGRGTLVAAGLDGAVYWLVIGDDEDAEMTLRSVQHHKARVRGLSFCQETGLIASASTDGLVCVWRAPGRSASKKKKKKKSKKKKSKKNAPVEEEEKEPAAEAGLTLVAEFQTQARIISCAVMPTATVSSDLVIRPFVVDKAQIANGKNKHHRQNKVRGEDGKNNKRKQAPSASGKDGDSASKRKKKQDKPAFQVARARPAEVGQEPKQVQPKIAVVDKASLRNKKRKNRAQGKKKRQEREEKEKERVMALHGEGDGM